MSVAPPSLHTCSTTVKLTVSVSTYTAHYYVQANAHVEVDDDAFAKCEAVMERLLELDDVDAVYTNCEGLQV